MGDFQTRSVVCTSGETAVRTATERAERDGEPYVVSFALRGAGWCVSPFRVPVLEGWLPWLVCNAGGVLIRGKAKRK